MVSDALTLPASAGNGSGPSSGPLRATRTRAYREAGAPKRQAVGHTAEPNAPRGPSKEEPELEEDKGVEDLVLPSAAPRDVRG